MALAESRKPAAETRTDYRELLQRVQRLHRQLPHVVKDELDREHLRELTSVQALLIYNIGDQVLTAGELKSRGHYLGSNVSYNLKKLVDLGFVNQERSNNDRRTVRISLTEAGRDVSDRLSGLFARQSHALEPSGGLNTATAEATNVALDRL